MTTSTATETATGTTFNAFKPRILHVAYHVNDIDRALGFYVGLLGMKEQMRLDLSKTLHEVILQFPDGKGGGVILMWDTARTTPIEIGDGYSRFVMMVSDIEAAMKVLTDQKTPVLVPVKDAGTMRYSIVKDPDGYQIELLQLKR